MQRSRIARGLEGVLLGVAAILVAGALPVMAMTLAASSATSQVRRSTFAGATATASAVANVAGQEYESAVDEVRWSTDSPLVIGSLRARHVDPSMGLVARLMSAGPFDAVALYEADGTLLDGAVGASGTMPAPGPVTSSGTGEDPIAEVGTRSVRRITSVVDDPGSGVHLGYVVANIDLGRLLVSPGQLRFGQTGVSKVVSTSGRVLSSPDPDAGQPLSAPENQRIAQAHQPATLEVFTPMYGRTSLEAYVPVAGEPFGVLSQQSSSEAFAGVRHLTTRLDELRVVFGVLGVALGTMVAVVVRRRDGRIERQNKQLGDAQALFRSAFDDAPNGAALTNIHGRYVEVNRALCALTGYERDELLQLSVYDITHPDDRSSTRGRIGLFLAGELDPYHAEKRYVRADGEVIWVEITASMVRDHRGRPVRGIGHITDITERKRGEAAIRTALRREHRATEELRRLEAARTDLLLTVSHDFRSPLTAIMLSQSLLVESWDRIDDRQRLEMLERLRRNCEALDRRVSEFLEYSRLEGLSIELDQRPCDLAVVLAAALDATSGTLARHVVHHEIPEGTIVTADHEALVRVFENLLTNAAKYSPAGSTIRIGVFVDGDEVTAFIDDEGQGVPADKSDLIFERFYRAAAGLSAAPGTGIGLSTVRRLVGLMGGRVWFESRASGGSSFRVSLPGGQPVPTSAGTDNLEL